jgi:HSP20 family protein
MKGAHNMFYPSLQSFSGDLFADVDELQRQMERLFGPRGLSSIRAMQRTFPPVNIGVTPDTVQIYAFAPGIDPQSLEVSVDKGLLTIAGQRTGSGTSERKEKEKITVYARERVEGEFRRVMSLPDDADPDRVNATYRNGVVQIEIQKREASRPRRIEVKEGR